MRLTPPRVPDAIDQTIADRERLRRLEVMRRPSLPVEAGGGAVRWARARAPGLIPLVTTGGVTHRTFILDNLFGLTVHEGDSDLMSIASGSTFNIHEDGLYLVTVNFWADVFTRVTTLHPVSGWIWGFHWTDYPSTWEADSVGYGVCMVAQSGVGIGTRWAATCTGIVEMTAGSLYDLNGTLVYPTDPLPAWTGTTDHAATFDADNSITFAKIA